MKKTILFTLDDYHVGGVTAFVRQYAHVLRKTYNIVILGFENDLKDVQNFFVGCETIVIPGSVRYDLKGRLKNYFQYYSFLKKIFRNYEIDIVHFSTFWSSLYSLFHPRIWSLKKISTFYGAHFLEDRSRFYVNSSIKYSIEKFIQLFILVSSDSIITFSNYSKNVITSNFSLKLKNRIHILPGFIDKKKIRRGFVKVLQKNKTLTLVNFGRAVPRKGLKLLLELTKLLIEQGYVVKTYIASPISHLKAFSDLDSYEELNLFDNVHFLHSLGEDQKNALLDKADLFVLPSLDLETFGYTIIESLSRGVPVIGTPVGAIPEILGKIDKHLLSTTISAKMLLKRVEWYVNLDKKSQGALKAKTFEVLNTYYSTQANANKLLKIYRDVS